MEINPIWTWQPGDPSTGGGLGGPVVIYRGEEIHASQTPPEVQHLIADYERKISDLQEEIGELKRENRIRGLLEELERLGYEF